MKNNFRKLSVFFLIWILTFKLFAQEDGSFVQFSAGGIFEVLYNDQGEAFTLSDLNIIPSRYSKMVEATECDNGNYFNVYYLEGSGFEDDGILEHLARRNVLCQVLTDISNFIPSESGVEINIVVMPPSILNSSLAYGSSFYSIPNSVNSGIAFSINDSQLWKTMNSGTDAYDDIAPSIIYPAIYASGSGFYHGMLTVNFENTNWHTDLSSSPSVMSYDLYTALLRQMLRMLGFVSLETLDGESLIDFDQKYSTRWDSFIQNGDGVNMLEPQSDCIRYVPQENYFAPNLAPGNVGCEGYSRLVGPGFDLPLYNPTPYQYLESLNYLQDGCLLDANGGVVSVNSTFAASGELPIGSEINRSPSADERLILAALDYSVNSHFGSNVNLNYVDYSASTISQSHVVGFNDSYVVHPSFIGVSNGSPIIIQGSDILGNDHNGNRFTCVELVYGDGQLTSNLPLGYSTSTFSYGLLNATPGFHILRYVPYDISTSKYGNVTYIVLFVASDEECSISGCNIISNGGFENTSSSCLNGYQPSPYSAAAWNVEDDKVSCWHPLTGSPDIYGTSEFCSLEVGDNNQGLPCVWDLGNEDNDHVLNLRFTGNALGIGDHAESVRQQLAVPIETGEYFVSFYSKSVLEPARILICGSSDAIGPQAFNLTYNELVGNPNSFGLDLVVLADIEVPQSVNDENSDDCLDWIFNQQNFSYSGSEALTWLCVGVMLPESVNGQRNVFIDDLSIMIEPQSNLQLNFPEVLCNSGSIDLMDFINVPGGYFILDGDELGITEIDPSELVAIDEEGNPIQHTLEYIIEYESGCVSSDAATFLYYDIVPAQIAILASPGVVVCENSTVTLTAEGIDDLVWNIPELPSTVIMDGVTVTASQAFTYSVTGTNEQGCMIESTGGISISTLNIESNPPTSTVCPGESIELYVESEVSDAHWFIAGASVEFAEGNVINVQPDTEVSYEVVGTTNEGCLSTDFITVFIQTPPVITISTDDANNVVCEGSTIELTASGAATYSWSPALGLNATSGAVVVASEAGNHSYTVTGESNGCSSYATVNLTIVPDIQITFPNDDLEVCEGTSNILLNPIGANNYNWTNYNPPGTVTQNYNGTIATVNPLVTTTYNVKGYLQGCTGTASVTVVVLDNPEIQISGSEEICIGSTLELWATGANSYSWSPSQYLNTPNLSVTLANPPVTTTYTVVGVGENNCTTTGDITITVNALPEVVLTTSANSICQGQDVVLSTTSIGSIQWFENGNPIGSNSSSITVSPSITSQYTLTVTNEFGCTNSESLIISVLELPSISISASSNEICSGSSLQLSAYGGINYTWIPANLVSDENGDVTNAFPTNNTQFVVLGQGTNGCVNSASISINVNPIPSIGLNGYDASPCLGDIVNILANPVTSVDWFNFGVIQQENSNSYSFTIDDVTSVTAVITNEFNCSASSTVVIEPLPLPDVSVVSDIVEGCGDDIVNLQAFGADTYLWTPIPDVLNEDGSVGSDMPLATTSYTVLGTDMNGCKSEAEIEVAILSVCCDESPNPPVSYMISGVQTWAAGEYWLLEDLIVSAGSYLTISGSTLHFAEGKKLIVREGAHVLASSTVFTNYSGCGYWEGIETRSTPTNRATLRFSFCTISFANTGFKNFETQGGVAVANSRGGQFGGAFQLTYKNNTRDMWFEPVVLPNAGGPYQAATFNKCIFILDDGYYGAQLPKSRIYLNKINPLFFENCDIINLVEEFTQQPNCLIGLEVRKSAFKMWATEAHYIKGFAYGIYQWYGTKWVSRVEDMTFNCYRGIYASGPMNNILIYRNDFLDPIFASIPTYQMPGVFNSDFGQYGTYIQGKSQFDIQGNVYSSNLETASYGCVVNDAGSFNNRIRGNSFYGQSRAINIYNRNRGNTEPYYGLTFSCNNIDLSSSSSILTYSPDVPVSNTYRGPASNQGGSTSAGNNIYNASDISIIADDIYNIASSPYTYRYHENDNLNLDEIYYQVSLFLSITENECEITYKNLNQLLIGQGEIQAVSSTLDLNKSNYLEIVDFGQTEELTDEIIFSTYSDALELYYNLMSKSPALSEQVMIEAIEKEFDLPAVLLTQILASNPTAAKNENVKNAIENRMIPLEQYQKEQIAIGMTLLSSKEFVEADLTELETKRAMLLLAMFDRIESDSLVIEKEVAKNALLYPNKYLNDRFLLINNFIESSSYPSARNLLFTTSNFFKLNASDLKEIQNLILIVDLLELNPQVLSMQQVNNLESLVMNGGAMSASYAMNILVSYGQIEANSPLYDVEGVKTPRSLFSSNEVKNLNCNIYPNPTSNILTIDLKDLEATEIRLTDVSGRIVLQQLGEWKGQQILDVSNLANGGYSLTIVTNQGMITQEVFKVR